MHRLTALALSAALAACTLALPGKAPERPAPVLPGAVEVTALATPASQPESTATPAGQPAPAATAPAKPVPPAATKSPPAKPAAKPATKPATAPSDTAPPEPAAPEPPPLAPEDLACRAKGGTWSKTGVSPLKSCIQPTRDGGKSCRKQSDCDGLCLARSRSCAPVTPMFGCNAILQADGSEATLCID